MGPVPARIGLVKHPAGVIMAHFQAKTPPNEAAGAQRFAGLWMKEIRAARRDLDEWSLGEQMRIDDEEYEKFCEESDDALVKEFARFTQEQIQRSTTVRLGG